MSDMIPPGEGIEGRPRFERVNEFLRSRLGAPTFSGPIWDAEYERSHLRVTSEIFHRILALWVVSLYAEGVTIEEIWHDFVDKDQVAPWLSPAEREFLAMPQPEPDLMMAHVWRIESAWVLLWALNHVQELSWPTSMCDTNRFANLLVKAGRDPIAFERSCVLRNRNEILDVHDLTVRLHWILRKAITAGEKIPSNLNWIHPAEWVESDSMIDCLIRERHLALAWLVGIWNRNWDDVLMWVPSTVKQ